MQNFLPQLGSVLQSHLPVLIINNRDFILIATACDSHVCLILGLLIIKMIVCTLMYKKQHTNGMGKSLQ